MEVLGIDFGGTGIKGAPVDTLAGALLAPRYRLPTPVPSRPADVAAVMDQIAKNFSWSGPIGIGLPGVVQNGIVFTAANIHKKWVGTNSVELISQVTGCPCTVLNDADAAGLAEMTFGIGRGRSGTVIIVTIGTGLGTALFTNGHLLPNAELGHLEMDGLDAEARASDAARQAGKLSWAKWAGRFNNYLLYLEQLFWPDLFILGGGVSKQFNRFGPMLTVKAEVTPAQFLNEAGIVGAALATQGL